MEVPEELCRPLRKVALPNGFILRSMWYTHPWLTSAGKIKKPQRNTKEEIAAIEHAYIHWRCIREYGR